MADEKLRTRPVVTCGKDFYNYYKQQLRDKKQEVFMVVLLDTKNRIIREEKVSVGSLSSTLVHPREVFKPAIRDSAASVAIVHNHPSGDPTPSPEDIEITDRLKSAADLIGIKLLDHVVVGEGTYVSFVDDSLF
jgi:DNA repair protein RadC